METKEINNQENLICDNDSDGQNKNGELNWQIENCESVTKKAFTLDIGVLIVIAFLRALSTSVFIVPNKFAPGGITGIASIIYNTVGIYNQKLADAVFNPSFVMFVLHLPLIIIAYFKMGKRFALRSAITLVMISVFLYIFSVIKFPVFKALDNFSSIKILAAVAGGVINGFCIGVLLRRGCSTGGTDLLGRLLQLKKPHYNVAWLIFLCDITVVLLSCILGILTIESGMTADAILVWILAPMLFSGITLFINSKVADVIIKGYDSAVVFQIITNKPDVIGDAIKKNLKKTATVLTGKGVYSQKSRDVVVFVVKKHCILDVKKLIQAVDPRSFTFITHANEVYGFGFKGY